MDKRQVDFDVQTEDLRTKIEEVRGLKEKAETTLQEKQTELERVARLSAEEAKEELFKTLEKRYEEDLMIRTQKLEVANAEVLDRKAKDILTTAIQRLANSTASDAMVTSVPIPSDDVKGKIIGKEGRNIRAFERAAGVDLIVDDTPGAITISSFDPVRRQIARVALENLILDDQHSAGKDRRDGGKSERRNQ